MLPDSLSVELAACALAFVYACWSQRAQGWADSSLIEVWPPLQARTGQPRIPTTPCICLSLSLLTHPQVRDSAVHGKGVFARASIATGTVLGAYPGRARTPQQVLQKAQHAPATTGFVFQNSHGLYLDPTDAAGRVSSRPGPGLPWLDVDPSLAYVNEPRPGSSVNVSILDEGPAREVRFVAAQDISPGEELFIDYGQQYDRSGYLPQP